MVTDRHVHTFTPTNTTGRAWREGGGEDLSQLLYSKTVGTMHLCSTSWLFEATGNARTLPSFFPFSSPSFVFSCSLVLFLPLFFFNCRHFCVSICFAPFPFLFTIIVIITVFFVFYTLFFFRR